MGDHRLFHRHLGVKPHHLRHVGHGENAEILIVHADPATAHAHRPFAHLDGRAKLAFIEKYLAHRDTHQLIKPHAEGALLFSREPVRRGIAPDYAGVAFITDENGRVHPLHRVLQHAAEDGFDNVLAARLFADSPQDDRHHRVHGDVYNRKYAGDA